MTWLLKYRTRLYLRNSLWIFPAIAVFLGLLAAALLSRIERSLGWRLSLSIENARTVMSMVAASMFTLMVVISSALLVAIQLASAQLTPRITTFIYRSTGRKLSLAVFAFTFAFSLGALVRIESSAPWLTSYVAAYGFFLNLVLFVYFIDSTGKALRPSSAMGGVALVGRKVVHSVYPQLLAGHPERSTETRRRLSDKPTLTIFSDSDGAVLAFDQIGIRVMAERSDCVIELVPEVGDFVAAGDPLFRAFGSTEGISKSALRDSVALGPERTLEQDPMFAFRIMVDIASKALSPAINDPTTAVLAIDQIHHLLRDVGNRYLADGKVTDASGNVRVLYKTADWEDFVRLAVTEIRQYGDDSIQVTRRLRAMLKNLVEILPPQRTPILLKELHLLDVSAKRSFIDRDDQAMATASDRQGIGGSNDHDAETPLPQYQI